MARFEKGQRGDPGGRPRVIGEIRDLAREYSEDAIAALVNVCRLGRNESVRVAAATALLDRGYGKPVQTLHATPEDPAELTDAELLRIVAGWRDAAPNTQHLGLSWAPRRHETPDFLGRMPVT